MKYYRAHREEMAARRKSRHNKHLAIARTIKLASGCVDCGYRDDPTNLHFDHIDPSTKHKKGTRAFGRGWALARIMAELAKCDVRCKWCHAKRTRQQQLNGELVLAA